MRCKEEKHKGVMKLGIASSEEVQAMTFHASGCEQSIDFILTGRKGRV